MIRFAMKEFIFPALSQSRLSEIFVVVQVGKRLAPRVALVLQDGVNACRDISVAVAPGGPCFKHFWNQTLAPEPLRAGAQEA